nr:hypothetical protein [Tanacetum cinerariifolium]
MWTDLVLAHEGPSKTKDTKIATLRLKFNAFKALEGEKVNGTFTRLKCLLNDLETMVFPFHKLKLMPQHCLPIRRDTTKGLEDLDQPRNLSTKPKKHVLLVDEESVSSKDEGVTKVKAFMAIADEEPSVGKNDAISGKRKKKDTISSKEVVCSKAFESLSKIIPEIYFDFESECENLKPLPLLPKLIWAEPTTASSDILTLADLTQTPIIPKETKKVPEKGTTIKAPKKRTHNVSPFIPNPILDKKVDSSTEQLLLTLMEEVKGLKAQIKDCYMNLKCSTCRSTNHRTKEHPEQAVVKKTLAKLKAQSSQDSSSRKAPMIPKPFKDCKYCGFNDHHSDECEYYP